MGYNSVADIIGLSSIV